MKRSSLVFAFTLLVATGAVMLPALLEPVRAPFVKASHDVRLRELPYPFQAAFSVADDIDNTTWSGDQAIQTELFDRFGFNWGRSIHVYARPSDTDGFVALTNRATAEPSRAIINAGEFENPTFYLLRSFHRGGIGYIHNWSDFPFVNQAASLIRAQGLQAQIGMDRSMTQDVEVVRNEPIHFPGLRFYFRRDASVSAAKLVIRDRAGGEHAACLGQVRDLSNCVWMLDLPDAGKRDLKAFFFVEDAVPERFKRANALDYKWASIRLEVEGQPGGQASIEEVLYSAFNKRVALRQAELLRKMNMLSYSFSDHGGADNSVNHFRQTVKSGEGEYYAPDSWRRVDPITGVSASNRAEGAKPGSDYYHEDVARALGAIYFLFGNDESSNFVSWNNLRSYRISDLLLPYRSPSGNSMYNVRRWFPGFSRTEEKADPYSITWNDRFGQALAGILELADKDNGFPVFGPMVTHLGHVDRVERNGRTPHRIIIGDAFNDETDVALTALSERYYNFSGRSSKRIWAPSINRLYRFAQLSQGIRQHTAALPDGTIAISRWQDPVTGETLPTPGAEGRDLAGITLYVPEPERAKVLIDGQPFHDFTRNQSDETGLRSITFIDVTTRTVVADELWALSIGAEAGAGATAVGDTPSGRISLRVPANTTVRIPVAGPARNAAAQTSFSFWARPSSRHARLSIAYLLEDGRVFSYAVNGARERPSWSGQWGKPGEWRKFIGEFTLATFDQLNGTRPPRGTVREVIITTGDGNVDVDQISFARDNPFPQPRERVLLSGRLSNHEDDVPVVVHFADGTTRETSTDHTGYFLFGDVPTGAIVRLEAKSKSGAAWYDGGRPVEVWRNLVELDIQIAPYADGRYRAASKIAWTSGLVPRDRRAPESLPFARAPDGIYRTYPRNRRFHWTGLGVPQEFSQTQYANNLGFLDRDRILGPGPQDSFNVVLFGDCLFGGDQFATRDKISIQLERMLEEKLNRPVQTPSFSHTFLSPYHFHHLYNDFGKAFRPKVVVAAVMTSTFQKASPFLTAAANELEVGAWPDDLLDVADDGTFYLRKGDSRFFMKKRSWSELDWRGGTAHRLMSYTNLLPWMQREVDRATLLVRKSLELLRDKVRADGGELILLMAQDRPSLHHAAEGNEGEMHYSAELADARFRSIASELGIRYLNLVSELQKRPAYQRAQWVYDPHWTPDGHRMTAEILVEFLDRESLLPLDRSQEDSRSNSRVPD
jgi:hypothetical protein